MKKIIPFFLVYLFFFNQLISQSNVYVYVDKNLSPGEEINAQVSGYNVRSNKLEFEIYRVKEPLKLATLKFDFLNFTNEAFEESKDNLEFVQSFSKEVKYNNNWFVEKFKIGTVTRKGTYLILARLDDKTSYSFFTCSEIGIISKRSVNDLFIYVSNRKSSQPLPGLNLKLISIDKKIYSLKSNEKGVALKRIGDRPEDRRLYLLVEDSDTTLLIQEPIYSPSDEYNKYLVYTYTNQPVYRPNQKIFFKSIIRKRENDSLITLDGLKIKVKIIAPDNSTLLDSTFVTNSFGTLNGFYELPPEIPLGEYTLTVEIDGMNYPSAFYVEEYKKPEYKVTIKTDKENYTPSQKVNIKVTAEYFFGKPLKSGSVKLYLYRKPLVRYWWEFEPFADFYRGCFVDMIPFYRPELLIEENGELQNGEFNFGYIIPSDSNQNYEYQVVAFVKDESNREVQGSAKFLVTAAKITVTTTPDRFFYPMRSNIILKVITTDYSFKPVQKNFKIIIQKIHLINYAEYYENIDTLYGQTQSDGVAYVNYFRKESGRYSYVVIVEEENKIITARSNFIVGDKDIQISGIREGIQIIPAKEIFNESDDLEFLIVSAVSDVNVLLTIEQSNVYDSRVIKLNGNSAIVKFNVDLPSVAHIFAGFYFNNQYFSELKKFGILKSKQKLNIEIYANQEIYKPGQKGKYLVRVKDHKGNPVSNAELSSSIIDESIFSIRPEQSQNIFDVFSQSSIYKILTTSIELPYLYYTQESANQKKIQYERLKRRGESLVTGKVINAITLKPVQNAEVKLVKDKRAIITRTDENGEFLFKDVPAGKYDLIIENLTYYNFILSSIEIKKDRVIKLKEIHLFPFEYRRSPIFYEDLEISGVKALLRKDQEAVMPEGELERTQITEEKWKEPVVRKDFKDAIYWNPVLVTDENGTVEIEVKFPDNLTSWRNSIKAITSDSRTGENYFNVLVRKNILIRVETPRYIHEGDEVNLPVLVHNYTSQEQKIRLDINIVGGKILSDKNERMNLERIFTPEEFLIKPDDVFRTICKVKVDEGIDTLTIVAKALVLKNIKEEESDAVELKIPVESIGIPVYQIKNFSLSKNFERKNFQIINNGDKRNYELTVKLSPTLIGNILSSIDELVGYPYGCVEQTMSRFLPAIIVANLINDLNIELKTKTLEELPKVIHSGLMRLKDFQHDDGGWGWWKEDQTNPFMTAYVVYGLNLTRKAGYQIDKEMMIKAFDRLRELLKSNLKDESVEAYLLNSFSEALEFSNQLYEDRNLISQKFNQLLRYDKNPFVLSMLLNIAMNNGFEDYISILKNKLLKTAIVEGNLVYWGEDTNYQKFTSDRIEITSNAIRSLILCGERSNLIENAIRWLINQKRGNLWLSTKQTASVIFSLSEYIKLSNELNPDFVVTIKLNDSEWKSIKFTKNDLSAGELTLKIPAEKLKDGKNQIVIEKSGQGRLYSQMIEKYYVDKIDHQSNLFEVSKKYYVLNYEKEGEKFVKKLTEIKNEVKVGSMILVEIKVKSKDNFEYFMLEDPFVPGFDRINELPDEKNFYYWFSDHKEERDKKTAFFITYLNGGEYTFSYLAYAQLSGRYKIPSPVASLMYYPDLSGYGEEKEIIITE